MWKRQEDEKEGERLGEREGIAGTFKSTRVALKEMWEEAGVDSGQTQIHLFFTVAPDTAGSMTDKYFCI